MIVRRNSAASLGKVASDLLPMDVVRGVVFTASNPPGQIIRWRYDTPVWNRTLVDDRLLERGEELRRSEVEI